MVLVAWGLPLAQGGSGPAACPRPHLDGRVESKLPRHHKPFPQGTTGAPREVCACHLQLWGERTEGQHVALGRNSLAAGPLPQAGAPLL